MGYKNKILAACSARSKQKLPYYNGTTGTGYGCSSAVRMILYDAGIITETERDDSDSLWAAQGKTKVLDDTTRFKKLPADTGLEPADIIMYLWHHVAINIAGGVKIFEAAPHTRNGRATHPLSDDGGEVGIYSSHSYNCAGAAITAIYRVIEEGDSKMKNTDLASKAKDVAKKYPTHYRDNAGTNAAKYNIGAWDGKSFCFDCSGLIKAILWGWNGDKTADYGGATYKANGVPDINDQGFHDNCSMQSISDWADVPVGACLWKQGHVGIYAGNKQAVECTPSFNGGVQITSVSGREWTMYGLMPWVEYDGEEETTSEHYSTDNLAVMIIRGVYGNGDARTAKLKSLGYTDAEITKAQNLVNTIYERKNADTEANDIAIRMIAGEFGDGTDRKNTVVNKYGESQWRAAQDKVNAWLA